ncbi:hypothetical protein BO94DRAFT_595277 [Aspergillus sclerotioniger CBS 115572]|uniref:Uncharacterized protein n=1 Tax=Aspergillus sclerotioniger CBS 115572 TaxID=1450535 RepID=A0A317WVM2_9EURO|nr:hypothetical protein BO94DRAFT_595277 [Aspergillus sclerotioniger CBS 115572]PWY88898.1 hypothetical protein BO94DRAFT_595277 [Aspergillus sclerotioniger CBS 115572]
MRISWVLITAALSWAPTAWGFNHPTSTSYTFDELWDLETKFWDNFLYPANVQQMLAINSTLFTADVQGRVDITRVFNGSELNTEYLFGLFSDPDHVSLVGVPIAYSITQFSGNGNIASATTVVTFNATSFNNLLIPVTIDTWIMWDSNGQIEQYDATFRWFGFLLDTLVNALATSINGTIAEATASLTQLLATTICATHDQYCTGDNQQYTNSSTCYDFLTQDIPLGKDYELGRNTLLCREVHEHMVQYDPALHCPHIGPTGGDYCVDDQTYAEKVLQKYFRKSWIAGGAGEYDDQDIWL